MRCIVVVKASLSVTFEEWARHFDAGRDARAAHGVELVFRHPVIGEQAVVFAQRTDHPRLIHDMMYHPAIRPEIEASGLVLGTEEVLILDADV